MLTRYRVSDTLVAVQIAEFMQNGAPRAGLRVNVRVPSSLRSSLGEVAVGEFRRFKPVGRTVFVVLKVGSRLMEFRLQDVIGKVSSDSVSEASR